MSDYFVFLSSLANALSGPIRDLSDAINIPLASAFLLGIIGAVAPCQLSTGIAALSYIARGAGRPEGVIPSALAYVAGKATVYTLLGGLAVLVGMQLNQVAIPVAIVVRKALGPLLVLIALAFLGVVRVNPSIGNRLGAWLRRSSPLQGVAGAYILGLSFGFVFCPTLFWLFFGLLIPLSITSVGGVIFPALFAAGSAFPLVIIALIIASGAQNLNRHLHRMRHLDTLIQKSAGIIFLLVGINETVLYWFLT